MIRLGIVGFSEGNGHPYSWSAICNGYDPILMETCGFPVIPRYLAREKFPESFLGDRMTVSAIWTQNIALSNKIANSCNIQKVVTHLSRIVDDVDGILLARDDAANHIDILRTIMPSGLPIYVDKPIALNGHDLETILAMATSEHQIFTCSAFRFSEKLRIPQKYKAELQKNFSIHAEIPKSWDKYSIHLIEPVLDMIPDDLDILNVDKVICASGMHLLKVFYNRNIMVQFATTGKDNGKITFRVKTDKREFQLTPDDTFHSFKTALDTFHQSILTKTSMVEVSKLKKIVHLLELGSK